MDITFDYKPLPVHAKFHSSRAYERGLFGAFGSGKTYAICAEAIAWALEQPGIRGLITRRTIPELRDTTETVFFDILPNELYEAGSTSRMGGHTAQFTFPNGSIILFKSIDDWNKHKSLNVGFIAWDEADEFDEETYMGMYSRVRQRDLTAEARRLGYKGEITRRGMWLALNPAGHNWTYQRFVDPKTRIDNSEFFRSTSFDNPYLPPEYLESLLQYPDPWVKRYVLCQFDDFGGQIYEDWSWDEHVIKPFAEPKDLFSRGSIFWMGMDPGTRNPTAGLWVYVDQEKRQLIGVAEYEQPGLSAFAHAQEWRKIEAQLRGPVRYRVADPTITTRDRGTMMGLDTQYARLGYNFALGPSKPKDRIPALGTLISQRRFKLTQNCPMTYEAIKNSSWEDITPAQRMRGLEAAEQDKKDQWSHLRNCAEYLASRWVKPMERAEPQASDDLTSWVWNTVKKNIDRKSRAPKSAGHDLGAGMV